MKKIGIVLLMLVALVACEGPMGPPGYDGEDAGEWREDSFWVRANDWEAMGTPNTRDFYYRHRREWKEMDEFAVERGIVVGYVEDYTTGGYTTLPHVFHDLDGYEFTETTSLSFYEGGFELQVTNSDFEPVPPGDKFFRIIIFK